MKTLVFGVLGNFNYKAINLIINGKDYHGTLIEALKEHYNADMLLFAPESLVTFIASNASESKSLIENWDTLSKNIKVSLQTKGIHADFVEIVPAVGRYIKKDKHTEYILDFYTDPTTVRSVMFLSLIEKIHKNKYDRLILDVSIGLNLYVSILQDIYRDIIVNRKLKHKFSDFSSNTWIAEIPPVVGNIEDRKYRVSEREYDVKVFFEFPYRTRFPEIGGILDYSLIKDHNLRKKIIADYGKIKDCMALYKLIFNAIKYNTPLMLISEFFKKEFSGNGCLNLKIMENIAHTLSEIRKIWLNHKKVDIKKERIDVYYPPLKSENIKTAYHSAALAHALQQEYKENILTLQPYTHNIMNTFERIYDLLELNLNKRFLQRDITNIESAFKKANENEWLSLKDLLNHTYHREHPEKSKEIPPWGDQKRNFFAHSGLLREFVCGRRIGNDVYLDYCKEDAYKEIKSWLENPND